MATRRCRRGFASGSSSRRRRPRHETPRGRQSLGSGVIASHDGWKSANLPAQTGALVVEVAAGAPAAAAGLKASDVIVRFQGEEIQDPHDLTRRVAATPTGTTVKLHLVRPGEAARTLTARVAELKDTRTAEDR